MFSSENGINKKAQQQFMQRKILKPEIDIAP
jgi:hypothetical protein